MQFAGHANRHQLPVWIEHVKAKVRNRLADRYAPVGRVRIFCSDRVDRAADHRLGRAVFVDQPGVRREGVPTGQRGWRQRFAADHHHRRAERRLMLDQLLAQHFQMRRGEFDQPQRGRIAQALPQGVKRVVFGQQFDLRTAQQWREQAGQGGVKGQCGGHHRAGSWAIGLNGPLQVMHGAGMGEQGALGLSAGTGRVDDVGQIIRAQAIGVAVGITVWQMRPMFTVGLQIDDHRRSGTAFDQATTGGIRQHRHRAAIGLHIGQPLRRIGRIQRHIRTARLQHRQQRHHHLHTTLHTDRHAIIRAHT